jgi:hypothetical protein
MPERKKPVRTVRTGEVIERSSDLSQINALLHRIQATATANHPPKTGNDGTPPATQTGKN